MKRHVYRCSTCGAQGVKLWREYQTSHVVLLCRDCVESDQGKTLTAESDQVGGFVPAVPGELPDKKGRIPRGESFWGYSSTPDWGVKWWHDLPPEIPHRCPENLRSREEEEADKQRERDGVDQRINSYIRETEFVVDATYNEYHQFWLHWNSVLTLEQIGAGYNECIGKVGKFPVMASCFWWRIEGKLVAFVEMTSRVTDSELLPVWIEKTFPVIKRKGWRDAHSDFTNFSPGSVAPDWSKDKSKLARWEFIHQVLCGREPRKEKEVARG